MCLCKGLNTWINFSRKYLYKQTDAKVENLWGNAHIEYITAISHEHHGIWNHWHVDCLFKCLFKHTTQKPKFCITGPLWGESTVTSGFPPQRASNVESLSIAWHHHEGRIPALYGLYFCHHWTIWSHILLFFKRWLSSHIIVSKWQCLTLCLLIKLCLQPENKILERNIFQSHKWKLASYCEKFKLRKVSYNFHRESSMLPFFGEAVIVSWCWWVKSRSWPLICKASIDPFVATRVSVNTWLLFSQQ